MVALLETSYIPASVYDQQATIDMITQSRELARNNIFTALLDTWAGINYRNPCTRAIRGADIIDHVGLLDQLDKHKVTNPLHIVKHAMSEISEADLRPKIEILIDLFSRFSGKASPSLYIPWHLLMEVGNWMPGRNDVAGYYMQDLGIGQLGEGREKSSFNTPIETVPAYTEAYREAVGKSFEALHNQKPFSVDSPFTVFLVGDGEGKLTKTLYDLFSTSLLDKSLFRLVIVDKSPDLLTKQAKTIPDDGRIKTVVLHGEAQEIESVLEMFPNSRGVVIAGEELVDDLSSYGISFPGENRFAEMTSFIENGEVKGYATKPIVPYLQNFMTNWVNNFPYYENIYRKVAKKTLTPCVAVNYGFLEIIAGIARSSFTGYYIGGDYCRNFRTTQLHKKILPAHFLSKVNIGDKKLEALLEKAKMAYLQDGEFIIDEKPFFALPVGRKGEIRSMNAVFEKPCNVTVQADPGLLAFAIKLGMKPAFLGRMGHFIDIALGKRPKDRKTVLSYIEQVAEKYTQKLIPSDETLVFDMDIANALLDEYSGNRFNWILTKGDVPDIYPDIKQDELW